jgi:Rieske Fe-S protein
MIAAISVDDFSRRQPVSSDVVEPNRRDFLVLAGNTFAAVGGAAVLWPFVQQMNPDASALAMASIEVDLAPVKEGQAITVMWRSRPQTSAITALVMAYCQRTRQAVMVTA